jgi:hypothetical protein
MYTWHNLTNKLSRLDYFLVSAGTMNIIETTIIKPGYRSDHSIVELTLNLSKHKKGPGLWKFNNSLLNDNEYVNKIKKWIADTTAQYINRNTIRTNEQDQKYSINYQLLFEILKLEIRGKTIAFTAAQKKKREKVELLLDKKIDGLHKEYIQNPDVDNLAKLTETQNELKLREKKK